MQSKTLLLLACGLIACGSPALAKDAVATGKQLTVSETEFEKHPSPGFSDEQLDRVHAIKIKYDDLADDRDLQLNKLYRQISEALNQQNVDKASLTATQNKINALEAEESNSDLQMMIELHDVLTAEQRTNLRRRVLEQEAFEGSVAPNPSSMLLPGAR